MILATSIIFILHYTQKCTWLSNINCLHWCTPEKAKSSAPIETQMYMARPGIVPGTSASLVRCFPTEGSSLCDIHGPYSLNYHTLIGTCNHGCIFPFSCWSLYTVHFKSNLAHVACFATGNHGKFRSGR